MIQNIERVHPMKREKILNGLQFIEKYNTTGVVKRIILFGSAVTPDCTEESDIDLYIVLFPGKEQEKITYQIQGVEFTTSIEFMLSGGLPQITNDVCDVIFAHRSSEKLKQEVNEKGIKIYEYT